jgi:shikimate kinase
MVDKSWVLVGMMGSGKSSVGRIVAHNAARTFHDTDNLIEKRLGRSIASFFKLYGEEAFRDHETSVLSQLEPGASVVSTGGGIVLRPQNWAELRRLGKTIYLQASADELIRRLQVSRKRRPLLAEDGWEDRIVELLVHREPLYLQADTVVRIDDADAESVAGLVQGALEAVS